MARRSNFAIWPPESISGGFCLLSPDDLQDPAHLNPQGLEFFLWHARGSKHTICNDPCAFCLFFFCAYHDRGSCGELVMERFQGKLMRGDKLMFDGLMGTITQETGPRGAKTWSGFFTIPGGVPISPGGPFQLVLDDGRRGDIMIDNVAKITHRPTMVKFKGVGEFK
jgi:hypothetical protein